MTIFQRLTKRISLTIAFIAFCLFTLTFGQFSPIEITLVGLSFIFYCIIIIGLPIVATKELRKLFEKIKNQNLVVGLKVLFIFILGLYILYTLFFCFGNTMCGDITDETLFIKKSTKTSKIIVRHFDCGATDSGPAKYEVVKVINIFSVFNFVTKVDTSKIDKSVWLRVIPHD